MLCVGILDELKRTKYVYLKQSELKGGGFEIKLNILINGTEKAWNNILSPVDIIAAPIFGIAVAAKPENPKVVKATKNSRAISRGKI